MTVLLLTSPPVYIMTLSVLSGIPTDEEQATGLEKIIMKAMKEGTVSFFCWISAGIFARHIHSIKHKVGHTMSVLSLF